MMIGNYFEEDGYISRVAAALVFHPVSAAEEEFGEKQNERETRADSMIYEARFNRMLKCLRLDPHRPDSLDEYCNLEAFYHQIHEGKAGIGRVFPVRGERLGLVVLHANHYSSW